MPKISKRVLSLEASVEVNRKLQAIGMPPTDRVIMAVLDSQEQRTPSGIILPNDGVEGTPNRGTIVQVGFISEDYKYLRDNLSIGTIITYGNYAGKQVEPDKIDLKGVKLMVISINEIMYFEYQ